MSKEYETLIDIIRKRRTIRKLKVDPIPDDAIEEILEAGRWAMSGANGQPWEYIVVKDPKTKTKLYSEYRNTLIDYNFWIELMRVPNLRHPAFPRTGDPIEELKKRKEREGWGNAPVLICVIGDGRKQWSTIMGGHTFGRDQSHLTDGLANTCTLIHLAAASLGLGSQWVTIQIEEPFKRILKVPDVYKFHSIIPIGYPDMPKREGVRRPISEITHKNQFQKDKYLSNHDILQYIEELRKKTIPKYKSIIS